MPLHRPCSNDEINANANNPVSENVRHLKDTEVVRIVTHKNEAGHRACVVGTILKSSYCDDTLEALKSLHYVVEAAIWDKMKGGLSQRERDDIDRRLRDMESADRSLWSNALERHPEWRRATKMEEMKKAVREGVEEGMSSAMSGMPATYRLGV